MYNVEDYRLAAKRRLPKGLFEFVDRGTEDEVALDSNTQALRDIKLIPRTLVDVSKRSTEVSLFERKLAAPIAIAPTGAAGLMAYQGELALARAAATVGLPQTLATGSLTAIETIAEVENANKWFQLYIWPDKKASQDLVRRVEAAGFQGLVVTVDVPVPSNREYNFRNGFTLPFRLTHRNVVDCVSHPRWLAGVIGRYVLTTGLPRYENMPEEFRTRFTSAPMGRAMPKSDCITWDDLQGLRDLWKGPLMIKGILRPEDAEKAISCGVDGIIVSNHGGRMLDSSIAPVHALPAIADQVAGRVPVLLDSGIRRGSDIVKALALGASSVLVGRAPLYGLTVDGEKGAQRVLEILIDEVRRVIGLIGCPDIRDLDSSYLSLPSNWPQSPGFDPKN